MLKQHDEADVQPEDGKPEEDIENAENGDDIEQPDDESGDDEKEAENDDEEGGDEEEESDSEPKRVERKVYTMPVEKAQREKKRAVERAVQEARAEFEKEKQRLVEELRSSSKTETASETADKISEVAEKYGLEADAARAFAEAIRETIPSPDLSKFDDLLKEREIEKARQQVSQEFSEKVEPLIRKDFPNATQEHIADVKKRLEELAFTEDYNTYRLEDIYTVKKGDFTFKHEMSAESPAGNAQELMEFKKLTDEEEIALADRDQETYAKYLDWLRGQESKYLN